MAILFPGGWKPVSPAYYNENKELAGDASELLGIKDVYQAVALIGISSPGA